MDVKALEERAVELSKQIEQSVASHHVLLGRLAEVQQVLEGIKKVADVVEDVVSTINSATNCS